MLQTLGRLHPILVHFPIALLSAALLAELRRPRAGGPSEAGAFCLTLGALGAVLAAASGWVYAAHDPPGFAVELERHRWAGVASATLAVATAASAARWRRDGDARWARATRVGLVFCAGAVLGTGALGGLMTYGEGFLLEPLRRAPAPAVREVLPEPARSAAAAPSPKTPAGEPPTLDPTVDYAAEIQPLFASRCYECHGDRKRPKGGLKLTDLAAVLAHDASEAAIVPGAPERSRVYQRLVLPAEHEDRMPPEGEPLAPHEVELVRRWIAQGARFAPMPRAPEPEPAAAATTLVLSEAERAARAVALQRLAARGVRAQRLSQSDEEVEVDFGVAAEPCGDAELALLAGLERCLVELSLDRTRVSDAGLARLADFTALRRLRLAHTEIGDAGLARLARLGALESLNLFGTRVGDASAAVLQALPSLARVYVGETSFGAVALEGLARARPELAIERGRLPSDDGVDQPRWNPTR